MSSILKAIEIYKNYQNGPEVTEVLKGINLEVNQGEVVIITGPSGVGKSTLLHVLGSLDKPSGGDVHINGQNVFELNDQKLARFRNENIGFVFQFHHLLPEFTALENVMLPGMMYNKDIERVKSDALKLLSEVGLDNRLNHKPGQLSGGERQRVAVARALINNPKLILADEPTGNLDKHNSESLYRLILNINKKFNLTFIIVTHNELMAVQASRMIELEDGMVKKIHKNQ
jgi:lipoprotein-releasing system ATP-binding protein